ncbi:hypothetical protein D3C78_1181610 [compost metagenome]
MPASRAIFSVAIASWSVCFIDATAICEPLWTLLIISSISCVEAWVRCARARTSSATTAKPRPCSPARAASMAALSASRLVCSAMARITSRTCAMLAVRTASCSISTLVPWTARLRFSIEVMVSVTRCMPVRADCSDCWVETDAATALRATSSTAAVISFTAVAASSVSMRWRCTPELDWWVTALISSAAAASCDEESAM